MTASNKRANSDIDELPTSVWTEIRESSAGPARRWHVLAKWVLVLVGVGVLAWQFPEFARQAGIVREELAHLRWEWIAAAAVLGVGALMLYGELHRRLLAAGGARLSVRAAQAIHFVENALSVTLPAVGNAAGFLYSIYQLRKRSVGLALASWSLILSGVLAALVLIVLGFPGLAWAGHLSILVAASLSVFVATGAVAFWAMVTHPAVLRRSLRVLAAVGHRMPVFCRTCRRSWAKEPDAVADRLSAQIMLLRPTRSQWLLIIVLSVLSWAMDYLSLSASVAALEQPVAWPVLIVGFLVVQASIAVQLFPGGAGLAEAGLFGVLVTSGIDLAPAAAIVLIYRLINWAGLAMLGWLVYAVQIHTSPPHRHWHTSELKATQNGSGPPEQRRAEKRPDSAHQYEAAERDGEQDRRDHSGKPPATHPECLGQVLPAVEPAQQEVVAQGHHGDRQGDSREGEQDQRFAQSRQERGAHGHDFAPHGGL